MKWCEIFKTGTHKDSKGNLKTWSKEDLEAIKSNFYSKNPDAPICCGHPKSNSPAYGWVDDLKIEDDAQNVSHLYASYKNVVPEFKEAYDKGLFKTRSISLTPDLVLRHIAFLGAQTPAIKGLEQFCFEACEDEITVEFQDSTSQGEFMNENEELQKQLEQKDAKIAALEKQIAETNQKNMSKEFEDFCDKAINDGHLLPAQRDDVLNILFACSDNSINFDDGSSKPVAEVFKNFVNNLKQFEFQDIADSQKLKKDKEINFSDSEEVRDEILKIQKEYADKGIDLNTVEAFSKLSK